MQSDHRVPTINTTAMRQQHRKRSYSNGNFRKRDRHDLICVVCHAPAMGYNFDQITCESCKAFFRRNALDNTNKLKCRSGTNDCLITLETRKRCKYCRLKKCFDKGLRKEWIMSEEEKRTKKQKIEDNRRLRAMSQSLSLLSTGSFSTSTILPDNYSIDNSVGNSQDESDDDSNDFKYSLNINEQLLLNQIEEHYTQAVRLNKSVIKGYDIPCIRYLNDHIECINEPAHISTLRMITFFKLTPEFNSLHEEDRLALVKHNVFTILYIHFSICTNLRTGIFHEPNTPNDFAYQADGLKNYSEEIYQTAIKLTADFQTLCSNDRSILKLLILIVLFSRGADTLETYLCEPIKAFSCQNRFVNLLWNYLNIRFGTQQTPMIFSRLTFSLLQCQSLARETKETITKKTVQIDELAPLMQSVLQVS